VAAANTHFANRNHFGFTVQKSDIQHEDQNYICLWIYTISPLLQWQERQS